MKFEDSLFESTLPVNTLACLNRMKEILEEAQTNSADILFMPTNDPEIKEAQIRYKANLWFLCRQIFIDFTLDLHSLWVECYEKLVKEKEKEEMKSSII